MTKPPMLRVPRSGSIRGKGLVDGPTKPLTKYWSVKEAPMEVMSGISLGAFRNGR